MWDSSCVSRQTLRFFSDTYFLKRLGTRGPELSFCQLRCAFYSLWEFVCFHLMSWFSFVLVFFVVFFSPSWLVCQMVYVVMCDSGFGDLHFELNNSSCRNQPHTATTKAQYCWHFWKRQQQLIGSQTHIRRQHWTDHTCTEMKIHESTWATTTKPMLCEMTGMIICEHESWGLCQDFTLMASEC